MEKEERDIPSSALLPQKSVQRGKLLCSSTTSPFLQDVVPKTIFHCSPSKSLVHGILWLLGSILCIHKYHLGWYPESRGFPWRTSGKNLHSKSTLSSVLLQDTVVKINPSGFGTSDFRFMSLDFCTGITLDYFPWGALSVSVSSGQANPKNLRQCLTEPLCSGFTLS